MKKSRFFITLFLVVGFALSIAAVYILYKNYQRSQLYIKKLEKKIDQVELKYRSLATFNDTSKVYINVLEKLKDKVQDPEERSRYAYGITEAHLLYSKSGVDATLVLAILEQESNFNSQAISDAGAVGPMQLLPTTAYPYYVRFYGEPETYDKFIEDLMDPRKAIRIGAAYLHDLVKITKLESPDDYLQRAVFCYFWGEGTMRDWIKKKKDVASFYDKQVLKKREKWAKEI